VTYISPDTANVLYGIARSSGYLEGWFTDPYDPKYKGMVLRSVTDNEKYDEEFPDHPLSRLRSTLKTVRNSLQFSE
jgi:hypothetical protein